MTGFVRTDVCVDWLSEECDVADKVEELVVSAFMCVTKFVVDRAIIIEHEQVFRAQASEETCFVHHVCFMFEREGAGRRDSIGVCV